MSGRKTWIDFLGTCVLNSFLIDAYQPNTAEVGIVFSWSSASAHSSRSKFQLINVTNGKWVVNCWQLAHSTWWTFWEKESCFESRDWGGCWKYFTSNSQHELPSKLLAYTYFFSKIIGACSIDMCTIVDRYNRNLTARESQLSSKSNYSFPEVN